MLAGITPLGAWSTQTEFWCCPSEFRTPDENADQERVVDEQGIASLQAAALSSCFRSGLELWCISDRFLVARLRRNVTGDEHLHRRLCCEGVLVG
jgi:hypothetical protein